MRRQSDVMQAVACPDVADVRAAIDVIGAAEADRHRQDSWWRMNRFLAKAFRSPKSTDAAFAGVQALRDLGTIDHAEAAVLFRKLFEVRGGLVGSKADAASEAAFYRARGEEALADLLQTKPDLYAQLCEGAPWSRAEKPRRGRRPVILPERTTPVYQPQKAGDSQSPALIDAYLLATFCSAWESDAECERLRQAISAVKHARGLAADEAFAEGQEPFEMKVLSAQLERRMNGIMAFWLRQYGEHLLASLLVERPDEYERLVEGGSFRWRRSA